MTIDDCLAVTVVAECNECSLIRALIYSDGTKRLEAYFASRSLFLSPFAPMRIAPNLLLCIVFDIARRWHSFVVVVAAPLGFLSLRFALLRFDYTDKQILFMTQKILEIIPRWWRGRGWLVFKIGKDNAPFVLLRKIVSKYCYSDFSVYTCELKSEYALERERQNKTLLMISQQMLSKGMNQTEQMLNWKGPWQTVRNELALDNEIPNYMWYIALFIKFPKIVCLLPACISWVNLFGL